MILELIDSVCALATVVIAVLIEQVASVVARSVSVLLGGPLVHISVLDAEVDGEEDQDEQHDTHSNNDPDPHHGIIRVIATVFRVDRVYWIYWVDGIDGIGRWRGYVVSGLFFFVRLSAVVAKALESDTCGRGEAALRHAHQAVGHVENAHELLEEDVAEVEVALLRDIEHSIHVF